MQGIVSPLGLAHFIALRYHPTLYLDEKAYDKIYKHHAVNSVPRYS